VTPRVLIAEPDVYVRELLETTVERLGYTVADADGVVDAVLLEPAYEAGRSAVAELGSDGPPVVCLSIYPREDGLEPESSVAYLVKPASQAAIGDALRVLLGP
jgi:CheY-like chemotaxis protein